MDFKLNEEHIMLKNEARDFFQKELPKAKQREILLSENGYSPDMWQAMASLGWQSLCFPEEYGGMGGNFLDIVVLLEEMGRAMLPSPFFSSIVSAGLFIIEAGSQEQKARLLPKIASGNKIFTLALIEPGGYYEAGAVKTRAARDKTGYRIDGTKLYVPNANIADYLICVAQTNKSVPPEKGMTAFIVDARSQGIRYTALSTIAKDKQYEVVFDKTHVAEADILGGIDCGWDIVEKVLPRIYVAQCAEMVGGFEAVLEMVVEHIKQTRQGGRLLGSFQAIQQMCADMAIDLDGSRLLTYEVAWKAAKGLQFATEASMAKAWVSRAYWQATVFGHQIMGGNGYVEDPDMGLFSRKAKSLELNFGDSEFHREKIAQRLGL